MIFRVNVTDSPCTSKCPVILQVVWNPSSCFLRYSSCVDFGWKRAFFFSTSNERGKKENECLLSQREPRRIRWQLSTNWLYAYHCSKSIRRSPQLFVLIFQQPGALCLLLWSLEIWNTSTEIPPVLWTMIIFRKTPHLFLAFSIHT